LLVHRCLPILQVCLILRDHLFLFLITRDRLHIPDGFGCPVIIKDIDGCPVTGPDPEGIDNDGRISASCGIEMSGMY
jgi:hypothetical protein